MKRAPGSYAGLTVKQADLLSYIRKCQEGGRTPSLEEMKTFLGLAAKSNVHRLVSALEERGYVSRQYGRARSIIALDRPVRICEASAEVEIARDRALLSAALGIATIPELIAALKERGLSVTVA